MTDCLKGVLGDAEYIYTNAIDVSVDMYGTKGAATSVYSAMQQRGYSTQTWSDHELHPTRSDAFSDIDIVNFIFTLDLLNFSYDYHNNSVLFLVLTNCRFWSDLSDADRYQVDYKDRRWTGYKSLLACLRRALDELIPITTPRFWKNPKCTDETLRHVFRSATDEEMPLLNDRIAMVREVGKNLARGTLTHLIDRS